MIDIDHAYQLRTLAATFDSTLAAILHEAADAFDAMKRWKSEAVEVLGEWEATWDTAGRPGRLGSSKALAVREFLVAYRKATGGLPLALVAKALRFTASADMNDAIEAGINFDEFKALRAATFEEPT